MIGLPAARALESPEQIFFVKRTAILIIEDDSLSVEKSRESREINGYRSIIAQSAIDGLKAPTLK